MPDELESVPRRRSSRTRRKLFADPETDAKPVKPVYARPGSAAAAATKAAKAGALVLAQKPLRHLSLSTRSVSGTTASTAAAGGGGHLKPLAKGKQRGQELVAAARSRNGHAVKFAKVILIQKCILRSVDDTSLFACSGQFDAVATLNAPSTCHRIYRWTTRIHWAGGIKVRQVGV